MYERLKNFSISKISFFISFIWGLAEGIFFFIVPDVYIGFASLLNSKSGILSLFFALFGSLLSAVVVFLLQGFFGNRISALLLYIPGIKESMMVKVAADLTAQGFSALVTGPVFGIPYKVYSTVAAQLKFPLITYLLWSIPSRLERMILVCIAGIVLGKVFRKKLVKHPILALLCYLILWIGIYVEYFVFINV